jgi:hypothetical protein
VLFTTTFIVHTGKAKKRQKINFQEEVKNIRKTRTARIWGSKKIEAIEKLWKAGALVGARTNYARKSAFGWLKIIQFGRHKFSAMTKEDFIAEGLAGVSLEDLLCKFNTDAMKKWTRDCRKWGGKRKRKKKLKTKALKRKPVQPSLLTSDSEVCVLIFEFIPFTKAEKAMMAKYKKQEKDMHK